MRRLPVVQKPNDKCQQCFGIGWVLGPSNLAYEGLNLRACECTR